VRLEGAQAYMSLHEVYRVLRLMVNGFQPSVKLQEKRRQGDHVRRVYDVAQTPLQRLLASGLLSDSRQQEVSEWFEHLDPLALSERLDAALQTPWSSAPHLPAGGTMELLKEEPCLPAVTASSEDPLSEGQGNGDPLASARCDSAGESQQFERFQTPLEVAILMFVQELYAAGRRPATLTWHKSSLLSLERYLRKQGTITEVRHVSRETLQAWLADLRIAPSVFTGKTLSVRSIATTARSARAFCNWLVRQGLLEISPFPSGGVPQTSDGEPRLVDSRSFVRFLEACQSCKGNGRRDQEMYARNRAMLWLLLETGLSVSDLCRLRFSEVDIHTGVVTVRGAGCVRRIFPLSASGKEAVRTYVEQVRMLLTWTPGRSEDQEILLLTGNRTPLTTNTVTQVFARLNQRAGLEKKPISPSMLRETYAIRFLQAGGRLAVLQGQLGVRDSVSMKRYKRFLRERGT
ncbi:MAG TPA: tyrosine-type recombinase/integrase, partial [Ktedonobacteraceae bacterium]|nr:tyrosine-type recombinase/integrase [Ktedonobacteraceae bacterium]